MTAFYTFLTAWGEVAYAIAFIQTEETSRWAPGCSSSSAVQPALGVPHPGGVLVMIPAGLVFFVAQRHLVGGLTAGGTKG